MLLFAALPYLIILSGLALGFAGVRPSIIPWGICMIGAASGIICFIYILAARNSHGWTHAWMFAAIALLPFIIAVTMKARDFGHPKLNDVTTDLQNPPAFTAALTAAPNKSRDMDYPARFIPVMQAGYPDMQPLYLEANAQAVFKRATDVIGNKSGWYIIRKDRDSGVIEAEAKTAVIGFVDDVIIRIQPEGDKTRVDMRSKSREGLFDAGKNASRIRAFFDELKGQ